MDVLPPLTNDAHVANEQHVATRSFVAVLVGVAGLFVLVALTSLVVGVSTASSNDGESPPVYVCGSPASFIGGRRAASWAAVDAQSRDRAESEYLMSDACPKAMAPRLGLTVWVLGVGLVAVTAVALALPAAATADKRHIGGEL